MLKVCVYDVAASTRGAQTILEGFYNEAIKHKDIKWTFILSNESLQESDNIEVKSYFWAKKSKLHRIFFEYLYAPLFLHCDKYDCIFSLQNICMHTRSDKQVVYIQQSIPFSDVKFDFKENRIEWIYQNIISKSIYKSAKKAIMVIVQTEWMKKALVERTLIDAEKVVVAPPSLHVDINEEYCDCDGSRHTFFYPAAYATYKNHLCVVKAVRILNEKGIKDFTVLFTIDKIETEWSEVPNQVKFIGNQEYGEILNYYKESTLVFPSKLETFGLPLLEAKQTGSRIIASDKPFSHEILDGYNNVCFFNVNDPEQLAKLMEQTMENQIPYSKENIENNNFIQNQGWSKVINTIRDSCRY